MSRLALATDCDPPAPPPERALWLAVVELAAAECFAPRCASDPRKELLRRYARAWVFGSPDFEAVCELAGVDPEFVRGLVRRRIRLGVERPRGHLRQVRA